LTKWSELFDALAFAVGQKMEQPLLFFRRLPAQKGAENDVDGGAHGISLMEEDFRRSFSS